MLRILETAINVSCAEMTFVKMTLISDHLVSYKTLYLYLFTWSPSTTFYLYLFTWSPSTMPPQEQEALAAGDSGLQHCKEKGNFFLKTIL